MPAPTVSVVMAVYNGEPYLQEAVESILAQTFGDFEFVIIDDGSVDGTARILDSSVQRDGRVQVHRQENQGLVAALNRGCELARGQYIARMDADDVALPNRLADQVEFLERQTGIGVVGGAVEFIDAKGASRERNQYPVLPDEIHMRLLDENVLWHPTVLFRSELFRAVGGYREVVAAEDYDLWLRVAERTALANLDQVVLQYRVHEGQVTERKAAQMWVSALISRGAAFARRGGRPDPLSEKQPMTVETLAAVVGQACPFGAASDSSPEQRARMLRSYLRWVYQAAGLSEACADRAVEALRAAEWAREKGAAAEVSFLLARLHRMRNNPLAAGWAGLRGLLQQPTAAIRLFSAAGPQSNGAMESRHSRFARQSS